MSGVHSLRSRLKLLCRLPAALSHAAVLEFFSAAAGAGIVSTDAIAFISDRLDFLRFTLRAVDCRLLLLADCGGGRRFIVDCGRFLPSRADETFVELFHAENAVGHAVADAVPH